MKAYIEKDPNAIVDYSFNWIRSLNGRTISTSQWTVPVGIDVVNEGLSTAITTVRLSGGTVGETYECVNRVTLTNGEVEDSTLVVTVKHG